MVRPRDMQNHRRGRLKDSLPQHQRVSHEQQYIKDNRDDGHLMQYDNNDNNFATAEDDEEDHNGTHHHSHYTSKRFGRNDEERKNSNKNQSSNGNKSLTLSASDLAILERKRMMKQNVNNPCDTNIHYDRPPKLISTVRSNNSDEEKYPQRVGLKQPHPPHQQHQSYQQPQPTKVVATSNHTLNGDYHERHSGNIETNNKIKRRSASSNNHQRQSNDDIPNSYTTETRAVTREPPLVISTGTVNMPMMRGVDKPPPILHPVDDGIHQIEMKARVRRRLQSCGTDVEQNDTDPYGDGDQSPITIPEHQFIAHEIFYTGGDFRLLLRSHDWNYLSSHPNIKTEKLVLDLGGFSEFAIHCISGHVKRVKDILDKNTLKYGKCMSALSNLLEKRETSLRLTPIMLIIASGARNSCFDKKSKLNFGYNAQGMSSSDTNNNSNSSSTGGVLLATKVLCSSANTGADIGWIGDDDNSTHNKDNNSNAKIFGYNSIDVTDERDCEKYCSTWEINQLKVIKLLLEYGARPDAKDVLGKTVVHYGAGVDATHMTMAAVSMCIAAAKSSFVFGKEIELRNMTINCSSKSSSDYSNAKKLDGKRGVALGYVVDTGCRIVYLFGQKNEIRVHPHKQMKLVHRLNHKYKPQRLCDVPDRTGRVPLLELYDTNRFDVAEFLLIRHRASINVSVGWDSISNITATSNNNNKDKQLATGPSSTTSLHEKVLKLPPASRSNPVIQLIYCLAVHQIKHQERIERNHCSQCHTPGTTLRPLRTCEPCMTVRFCSDECQLMHWRAGHMNECKYLSRERNMFVLVNQALLIPNTVGSKSGGMATKGSYCKPSYIAFGHHFTVKVQYIEEDELLWIYDKTKECEFYMCVYDGHEDSGYEDLLDKIISSSRLNDASDNPMNSNNRKHTDEANFNSNSSKLSKFPIVNNKNCIYINAVFVDPVTCKLFINQTKLKTW